MIYSDTIKKIAIELGAERCGVASVERFSNAPKGFKPKDIYSKTQSVVVFVKQMPTEIIMAENPIPYTSAAYLLYNELDKIGLNLCRKLQEGGFYGIPIPADTPYLFWDEKEKRGQGILSLRHAALNAGLGILGRNTLLINPDLGNMVYIGAILTDLELTPDPLLEKFACPTNCSVCLDICPQSALDGNSVNQKLCREVSFYKNERNFDIYDCNKCRKTCVLRLGRIKGENETRQ